MRERVGAGSLEGQRKREVWGEADEPEVPLCAPSKLSLLDEELLAQVLARAAAVREDRREPIAPGKLTRVLEARLRTAPGGAGRMSPAVALGYARWMLAKERGWSAEEPLTALDALVYEAAPRSNEPSERRTPTLPSGVGPEAPAWREGASASPRRVPVRSRGGPPVLHLTRMPVQLAARAPAGALRELEQGNDEDKLGEALALIQGDASGEPISPEVLAAMRADLGGVSASARVHTSALAAEAARLLGAQAFTIGHHIYFAAGQYAPGTDEGDRLLRHELTHVAQHERGELASRGKAEVVAESSGAEAEARGAETRSSSAKGAGQPVATAAPAPARGDSRSSSPAAREQERAPSFEGRVLRRPDAGGEIGAIPPGGKNVGKVGIVAWDGEPRLRLRSSPSTTDSNVVTELAFNTHVAVIKEMPGKWFFISTGSGQLGYVARDYIKTNLPEPGATLHKVQAGKPGFAISIAEQYYKKHADDWGQLRRIWTCRRTSGLQEGLGRDG